MSDILDAIMRVSHAFRSCGLNSPAAIILATHEDGMRLVMSLHDMRQTMTWDAASDRMGKVIEHPDGSTWKEVEVYGMKIHYPAVKMALPKGGYVWA